MNLLTSKTFHIELSICFVILKVSIIAKGVFVESSGISAEKPCSFDAVLNSKWKSCVCESVDGEFDIHVRCRRQPWTVVPTLPANSPKPQAHNETLYNIVALSITDSSLSFLAQDAFKNQNIQVLDLTHNHISNINVNAFRGLQNKLYQLVLSHNSISTIPSWSLTYLYQLQYLYLQNNIIAKIKSDTFDETQLKNLHYLHLDNNQISILLRRSLYRLPLQVLTISNNRIFEVEKLSLPPSLWYIDLKNNVLQKIPYLATRELKELKTLDLEGNNITEVQQNKEVEFISEMDLILSNNRIEVLNDNAFDSFHKFNKLDLSYNQISKIGVKSFNTISQIKELDLSYNRVVHIPLDTFINVAKSLQRLNLEENRLHKLPAALVPLRTIEYLNLNSNKLMALESSTVTNMKPAISELLLAFNRLTDIPTEALDGMTKLRNLDLSKNRIKNIHRLAFGSFDGTGTSLLRLNLAGNQIEKIDDPASFLYMSSLAYLDLSYNRITTIVPNAFGRLEGLESLFLQHNLLTVFPEEALNGLEKLRYLLLDSNPIETLPNSAFHGMRNLERLSLSRTLLQSISDQTFSASSIAKLKSLNIGFCRIERIATRAFHGIKNLEQLLLNDNQLVTISSLAFSSMGNLKQLILAGNRINTTMERAISDLPSLEQLSLARNFIRHIPKASLINLNNLEQLDLSHNQLRTFDFSFLEQSSVVVKHLDLSYNQIASIDLTAGKRSLVTLRMAHNQLQSIGKDTMRDSDQLTLLDLSHNGIIEVQSNAFLACPRLSMLNLGNNHLRTLRKGTFANQELYTTLILKNNAIVAVDADTFGLNNVHHLDLSYNELKEVPQHALTSIQNSIAFLDLRGNRIQSLDKMDFDGMKNLTELVLADNHIETVEEGAFASIPKLAKLDLSHNPITSWNPEAFRGLSNSIELLNLANTGLFSLPGITNRGLRHLNISRNKINELSVSELKSFNKLISLDMSYNNFKKIDPQLFDALVELKHLNISGNRIEKLAEKHFASLYHLQTLSIYDMAVLHRLPEPSSFRHLRQLRYLQMYSLPRLSYYNMSELLRHLPPLRTLAIEIKDTQLSKQLHTADLRLLRNIIITGPLLAKIDTRAFANLRGYKLELTIRDTLIDTFPQNIFNTLTSISFLSLSLINNRIETFDPFPHTKPPVLNQQGTILQELRLTGNPMVCDCRLKWITSWLEYVQSISPYTYSPLNDTQCADQARGLTLFMAYSKPNQYRCPSKDASFNFSSNANKKNAVTALILILIFLFVKNWN